MNAQRETDQNEEILDARLKLADLIIEISEDHTLYVSFLHLTELLIDLRERRYTGPCTLHFGDGIAAGEAELRQKRKLSLTTVRP